MPHVLISRGICSSGYIPRHLRRVVNHPDPEDLQTHQTPPGTQDPATDPQSICQRVVPADSLPYIRSCNLQRHGVLRGEDGAEATGGL